MSKHTTNEVPYGYCHCGCGQKTRLATRTRPDAGWIKGEPLRYINGHQSLTSWRMKEPNPSGMCMCGCGQPAPIAKRTNVAKGSIAGKPVRFVVGHSARVRELLPTELRFWEKIERGDPDECWLWQAGSDQHGYGTFWDGERLVKAHRFSYKLAYGALPDELDCLHRCDNPRCINPAHLFLGTAKDNSRDMVAKGRASKVKGENASNAMFTNEQARCFREEFAERKTTVRAYAIFKAVPYEVMRNIIRGNTYKDTSYDMVAKPRVSKATGRTTSTILYTDEEVRQFREEFAERGTSMAAYAAFKDVPYEVMRNIIRRKSYIHI